VDELGQLIRNQLRKPVAADNKYSRGVVGFVTGSQEYPGSALLGVAAAEAIGVGMIRYFGPERVSNLLLSSHPQVVTSAAITSTRPPEVWVLGSGVESTDIAQGANIRTALEKPCVAVIDAGAIQILDFGVLREHSLILTPHDGELAQLFARMGEKVDKAAFAEDASRSHLAERAANLLGQPVLLKGSVSILAQPGRPVIPIGPNSPFLATAGTGDVLAGLLAGLAASAVVQGWKGWEDTARLAVVLHSAAAEEAARSGPMVAGRLSHEVSKLIRRALA